MKKDNQERFIELLSPTSTNFMGSGLTLEHYLQLNAAEKCLESWSRQDVNERKRRLSFVSELCIELAKIKETAIFATGLAELSIESIIEGDWKMVKEWSDHFAFASESDQIKEGCVGLFSRFKELLTQAYDTRPNPSNAQA